MEIDRARAVVRQVPDLAEDGAARGLAALFLLDQRLDLPTETVERRVLIAPTVGERGRVEGADLLEDFRQIEEARARGDQQADRKLYRRDIFHQVEIDQGIEQLAVIAPGGPGREREEGGRERQAGGAGEAH